MSSPNEQDRSPAWLLGEAGVEDGRWLPFMACASKSSLRAAALQPNEKCHPLVPECGADVDADGGETGRSGLRLIINDDHGMTPTVTIVNLTEAPVTLRTILPSLLATENGTYDLEALLAGGHPTLEPDAPLVFRIVDIGRNAGEPFRVSHLNRQDA